MDYRKDVRTPKDRVDDDLLRRLLSESDELLNGCGCDGGYAAPTQVENRHSVGSAGFAGRKNNAPDTYPVRRDNGGSCTRAARREDTDGSGNGCKDNMCGCGCKNKGCGCARCQNAGHCGCKRAADLNGGGCARNEDSDDNLWDHGCINKASLSIQTQGLPLVMSYAPDQAFHELYEDEEVLANGTLFRELNFPFYGTKCGEGCRIGGNKNCGCSDEK